MPRFGIYQDRRKGCFAACPCGCGDGYKRCAFYDGAFPNPTTELAKEAYGIYKAAGCDSIIALGGGSPMDLSKAVGILAVKPKTQLRRIAGILKVRRRIPTYAFLFKISL